MKHWSLFLTGIAITILWHVGVHSKPIDSTDGRNVALDDKNGRLWTLFKSRKKLNDIGDYLVLKGQKLQSEAIHPQKQQLARFKRSLSDLDQEYKSVKERRAETDETSTGNPAPVDGIHEANVQSTAKDDGQGRHAVNEGQAKADPAESLVQGQQTVKPVTETPGGKDDQQQSPGPNNPDQVQDPGHDDQTTVKPNVAIYSTVKKTTEKPVPRTVHIQQTVKPTVKSTKAKPIPEKVDDGLKPEQLKPTSKSNPNKVSKVPGGLQPTVISTSHSPTPKKVAAIDTQADSSDEDTTVKTTCEGSDCIQVRLPGATSKDAVWALGSLTFLLLLLTGAVLYTGLWKKRHGKLKKWHKHDKRDSLSVAALLKKSSKSSGNGYHHEGSRKEQQNLTRIREEDTSDDDFV